MPAEVVGVGAVLGFGKVRWEERGEGGLQQVGMDGGAEADLVELWGGGVSGG